MLPDPQNDLRWKGAIPSWDEGIPLGNGRCGCLLWGDGRTLRLSLDRGDLWETTSCAETLRPEFTYDTMIRMVRERRWEELSQLFESPCGCPYPTKLAAGRIVLEFGACGEMESRLSLGGAAAETRLMLEDGPLALRAFLHAERQAGFLHLSRVPEGFSWRVECPAYQFGSEKKLQSRGRFPGDTALTLFQFPDPERVDEPQAKGFFFTIDEARHYGVLVRRFHTGEGEWFLWDIQTADSAARLREALPADLDALAKEGFGALEASHTAWWRRYWEKSGVRVSDKLFEKNWYLTQYLLGACSRKGCPPMPLQGVWTADDGTLPPWKGDYHNDLNTQMSYYAYLKANRLEAGESFLDFLWELVPAARQFAREFYHAEGICLPAVMTLEGRPLCGWAMYSFSPACQIWLSQLFERHYRYTGDDGFLRGRAYPYMKETARFIECLLREGADGLLYLPLSSSPELHDNLPEAWLTPNSNYDLSLMRYLFSRLAELAGRCAPEDEARWRAVLARLPELAVNEKHVYRIAPDEDLKETHRHFSHLMAIYPLRLTPYDTPEHRTVIDACIDDLELLGTGLWVGYTFCWMAQLYAVQGNGEGAATQLELFWRYFCAQNGFHLNGDYKKGGLTTWHYRPFTLEGNMLAADALQEMLLYSEGDELRLFPAVPARFAQVEFESFRAQNGLLVSARLEDGRVREVRLQAQSPCTVVLKDGASLAVTCGGLPCGRARAGENDLRLTFG